MKNIILISCSKRKRCKRARSQDLYVGELFRKSLSFAQSLSPDDIYILSAKYGLLHPDEEIDPYEETLNKMPVRAIKTWSDRVLRQLADVTDLKSDQFTFLAGEKYRRFLLPHLPHHKIPMLGLGIGKQLKFLETNTQ